MKKRLLVSANATFALAFLVLLSCESLADPRAWGNGDGGTERPERAARRTEPSAGSPAEAPKAETAKPVPEEKDASADGPRSLARGMSSSGGAGAVVIKAAIARVDKGTVLKGSCFDFASAVFEDAGFPPGKRETVFSGKEKGPFADPALLRPGDWVQFTHMYSATVGHSAIFVAWLDFENRTAMTVDYPGNSRAEPGRYRVADLYKVWGIVRAAP